ncbi:aa3-type cytochrome c oxidase subunit IV [Kordiimonas sp. SCSIO 12610]|nr:aa3-type cytochrome c oxidase subunit IV [Kordiimonas sp. SCSIO 12610]UTW54213.1 aa3-type cytochrome c oxidase subunit IV [Kordiimonas sp. SCSIO 12610]
MEIKDQENTFEGFTKWMIRGTVACLVVLVLLAMFVA